MNPDVTFDQLRWRTASYPKGAKATRSENKAKIKIVWRVV
jgi:hypothetical protein